MSKAEVQKNETEKIIIQKKEFKGKEYVDIRLFYQPANGGDYLPTKKGVTMGCGQFEEFKSVLDQVEI